MSIDGHDEDLLDALASSEDVAAMVGGDEFASSFRLGATAFEGLPALLGPTLGPRLLNACEEDAGRALDLERRLLRALEAIVDGREFDRTEAQLALGGWLPWLGLAAEARDRALSLCPELG